MPKRGHLYVKKTVKEKFAAFVLSYQELLEVNFPGYCQAKL